MAFYGSFKPNFHWQGEGAMKKRLYTLRFFLAALFFFNLIGLVAFSVYPKEIHQKYLLKKDENIVVEKYNGLGAIGDVYQGQPFRIAFFGTSVLLSHDLNFDDKISQKLKQILGERKVHIDNFSIGSVGVDAVLLQMKVLRRLGIQYDIVFLSIPLNYYKDEGGIGNFEQYHYYFSRRWLAEDNILALPSQIKHFFGRHRSSWDKWKNLFHQTKSSFKKFFGGHRQQDKWAGLFYKAESGAFLSQMKNLFNRYKQWDKSPDLLYESEVESADPKIREHLLKALNGSDFIIREVRMHPLIQTRLAEAPDYCLLFAEPLKQVIQRSTKRIKQVAGEITDRIYFAPIYVAYHPRISPDFYITVEPHCVFEKEDIKFYNAKALYQKFAVQAENSINFAKKSGIKILDYSKFVESQYDSPEKPYWENPTELYLDEYHFSAKGSLLAAGFLAEEFRPFVEAKIKNQDK